mgnify:FL=1
MKNYEKVGLYEHNIESYEKVKEQFEKDNTVALIQATGTGKTYNALQLAYDNPNEKIIYVVPSVSIIEHIKEVINRNPNLNIERDFHHVEFRTYQSFINLSSKELKDLNVSLLILDEFHHIGAPVWGARINEIIETHSNIKVFGMTAYTVRDRGTSYERDMVNPEGEEIFSNKVASNYDLCDAMIDAILPKPIYKSAYIHLENTLEELEKKLEKENYNSKNYKELSKVLNDIRNQVHMAPSMKDVFKENIKKDGKYYYFCPLNSEENVNDIGTIMEEVKTWCQEMGLTEDDYEFYLTTSEMKEEGKKNRQAFYNDEDLNGNKVNQKLRIMFAINQYNEGVHAPGVDGVIMGRSTKSDIIYYEQLGRGLSVRENYKEEYDKLYQKDIAELRILCKEKNREIKDDMEKEEIIETLLAPIIIDLANNIDYIKELENNLKDRVKEVRKQNNSKTKKRVIHLSTTDFNISMINQNLYEILKYVSDRLSMTWMEKYNLAKAYFEHYGNLEIPRIFKTINGYEYDENGIALGTWIVRQRTAYKGQGTNKITPAQIKLLEKIGMRFENIDIMETWMKKYKLAKTYFEHYGNLEIPTIFKTTNGYEYDENGIALGTWIVNQRIAYKGNSASKITPAKIKLLKEIGMRFENIDTMETWMEKYKLAKTYFEHYGNLEIPQGFKTINGYDYDENGVTLGLWIVTQRQAYKGKSNNKITPYQIKLLKEIGMRFENIDTMETWIDKYKLAKTYFEHYGNLEIPTIFKTINGYEYDENGIALGMWIGMQRRAYKGQGTNKITPYQIKLLKEIGMRFENKDIMETWMEKYNLAKVYFEHYDNLEIPKTFKTINGYDYDENGIALGTWIVRQRTAYKGNSTNKITPTQIKLLEEIGMRFETANKNKIWIEKYNLAKDYFEHYGNLEIPTVFKTTNGHEYDENGIALGQWIANQRNAYKGTCRQKITPTQIKLLEEIGMKWFSNSIYNKFQKELITEDNLKRKQTEIMNRFTSYLNHIDNQEIDKDTINQGFVYELNRKYKG